MWLLTLYYPAIIPGLNSFPFGETLKTIKIFFYCPNTYLAFCFINLSSTERVQTLKFARVRFQKLCSRPEAIPLQIFSFDFNLQPRILFNVLHFHACPGDSFSTYSLLFFTSRRDSSFCIAAVWELLAIPLLISIAKFIFQYHTRASTQSASNTATCHISIVHSH